MPYELEWTEKVEDLLSYTNYISDLVMVVVVFNIITLLIMLFLEKYDPGCSSSGWSC